MEPVELRAVWKNGDGTESVQTGIYVFDCTTIEEIRRLMEGYAEEGERIPDYVEVDMKSKEEDI